MADSDLKDYPQLNIYQKIAKITGEVGLIKKGGTNKDQGYAFIEYAAVAGELRSLFAKYGVVIVPRMQVASKQSRNEVESKYGAKGNHALIDFSFNVVNADKPDDKFTVPWTGEALSFDDKGTNKAATSALKYYLMRQFNISEKGEDPDAESPTAITQPAAPVADGPTEEQFDRIEELAPQKGKDVEWLKLLGPKLTTTKAAAEAIAKLEALEDV
ncbi:hypothetical protein E3O44_12555 [Cryobacterium algoricola]|uniref:Single-stranded DNA-binding protein n=1 Tax=Cryobacterium algoricola TaxID=1259183 RepID=A0ABY2IAF2_9MICO|nr:ERF family protein [Cryobacterium algoricola]TFB85826.1 hypothetical protein E3O44_12555 [Cryobacterium algoricola]